MKISMQEVDRIIRSQLVNSVQGTTSGIGQGVANDKAAGPAVSIEISSSAQEIQRLKRAVQEMPDVREDMVDSIKARMDSGTYSVTSNEVADLMIRRAYADTVR
jgi:negative regulator of flagellin synthesis FlgM